MADNKAPHEAEISFAVVVLGSDQADHRAAFATPATKILKLSYKHFASPASAGGRPQGPFWHPLMEVCNNLLLQAVHVAHGILCVLHGIVTFCTPS